MKEKECGYLYEKISYIQALLWMNIYRIDGDTLAALRNYVGALLMDTAEEEGRLEDLVKDYPWIYHIEKNEDEQQNNSDFDEEDDVSYINCEQYDDLEDFEFEEPDEND